MNPKAEKGIGCSKTQLQGFTFIEILNSLGVIMD